MTKTTTTRSRFDGTKCEYCSELLEFHQPPGADHSNGEVVDIMHAVPWCAAWRNPLTRERCVPKTILQECHHSGADPIFAREAK